MKLLGYKTKNYVYKFYQNYDIMDGKAAMRNESKVGDNYFSEGGKVSINLCAIVGENGSGKSTILELMFRIMNNVAFALQKALDNFNSAPLFFAEGVYARLFFENEKGEICCIEQKDLVIRWINQKNESENWEFTHTTNGEKGRYGIGLNEDKCRHILESMFYTIVVNYSSHALNAEDFRNEWEDKDELTSISGYYGDLPEMMDIVTENFKERCWLESLFHKNDGYQIPIVFNPYREKGNIDINKEEKLVNERLYLMLLNNRDVVKALLGGKEPRYFEFSENEDFIGRKTYPLGSLYLSAKVIDIVARLVESINTNIYMERDNFIRRLGKCIITCWQRCYGYKFVEGDILKLDTYRDKDQIAALNYIIYKTIKVTLTYGEYGRFRKSMIDLDESAIEELVMTLYFDTSHITLKLRRAIAFLTFEHYWTKNEEDPSKISPKIPLDKFTETINSFVDNQNVRIMELLNERGVDEAYTEKDFISHRIKNYKEVKEGWKKEELLPAPCINTSIILSKKENGDDVSDEISFDTLSSGEKQFLYSLGTTIYQLHNLDSVSDNKIQYRCVNLVFDEIELYFHPKYQKQLIKRLIKVINSIGAGVIKHVNVIMATHSPFILSDIPKENILYLENGIDVSEKIKINPFGANIFDLFRSSFFMGDGLIGEYAWEKILQAEKSIKNAISNPNDTRSKDIMPLEEAKKIVKEIGDDRIKEYLIDLLSKIEPDNVVRYYVEKIEKIRKRDIYRNE